MDSGFFFPFLLSLCLSIRCCSRYCSTSIAKANSSKAEKDVTITLRIPPYIAKDLKIKAATADKTQRQFILEGLKLMGIDVKDEDIADRRKS